MVCGLQVTTYVATSRGLDRLRSMAALYGHTGEFEEAQKEWHQYAEWIQHYFAAKGVTDAERKCAMFLSVIGLRTYNLLSSLVALSKPGEKTYDELVVALTEHHSPTPSEIVQQFKFCSTRGSDMQESQLLLTYWSCAQLRYVVGRDVERPYCVRYKRQSNSAEAAV